MDEVLKDLTLKAVPRERACLNREYLVKMRTMSGQTFYELMRPTDTGWSRDGGHDMYSTDSEFIVAAYELPTGV